MNKTLSLILRITIAMLGLVYIVWVIDWIDHVELAAGNYQTDDGQQVMLEEARAFRVISGDFDPRKVSEPLVLSMGPPVAVMGGRFTVKPEMLTQENTREEVPRFKLRPGIITTVRHANMGYLLLGLLLIVPIYPITAFRWWLLLRARGLVVQPFHAFRLCMVGCFFNYCMPGSTGGDVIKAYYAAKNSDRRADAVMTVVIDRIVGLLGLFVLAGIAGLFIERDAGVRQVTWFVWAVAGGGGHGVSPLFFQTPAYCHRTGLVADQGFTPGEYAGENRCGSSGIFAAQGRGGVVDSAQLAGASADCSFNLIGGVGAGDGNIIDHVAGGGAGGVFGDEHSDFAAGCGHG
ncbi:MAG: flippase-like domain-containing protein [Phycisphaerales bacterium]|nr:flippase-like domain-containing protein [Phycisphaerales bacterium]